MNPLLEMLMNAGGGGAAQQIGQKFGLSEEQTSNAMGQLLPALMNGLQNNTAAQGGGLESILGMLGSGNHGQYLDNPEMLGTQSATDDGNSILGQLLGSKEASRALATQASEQTGIGADVLKQMLPLVATMVMGGLSRQPGTVQAAAAGQPTDATSMLTSLLDQNRDGSVADDVTGLLGKLMGGR